MTAKSTGSSTENPTQVVIGDVDLAPTPFERLREPFPKSQVGLLPATSKRPPLEYVGHGAVTERLLDVDPKWTWTPMAHDENGHPVYDVDNQGRPIGLWINLTVNGVTRPGYGDCDAGQFNAVKVLIGDALRNAAMRFGIALDLWVRGQAEDDEKFRGEVREETPSDGFEWQENAADLQKDALAAAGLIGKSPNGAPYKEKLLEAAKVAGYGMFTTWLASNPENLADAHAAATEYAAIVQELDAADTAAQGPQEPPKRTSGRKKPGSAVTEAQAAAQAALDKVKESFPGSEQVADDG